MKYLIWFLFIITIVCIFLGISIPDSDTADLIQKTKENGISNKLIGFGVIGLCADCFSIIFFLPLERQKDG